VLSVADDGVGVHGPVGAGVRGMMERALLVDAELTLAARPHGGTEVRLSVPATIKGAVP
jgi:two-component system sensor histidine kinase UhpB